jgi:tetratricopeptide (TPR) repeat protein
MATVGEGTHMNGQVPRKTSALINLGGPVIAALLWWINHAPHSDNACKSPFASPYERALALDLYGDKAGAIAAYSVHLNDHSDDRRALSGRGIAYLSLRQADPAIADLTAVLRLQPDDYAAASWRGDAYLAKGDYDDAIADYTRSMDRPPEALPGPFYSRGLAYLHAGRYALAQADFVKEIALHPGGPGNEYAAKGRECAAQGSHEGACGSLPLDPNPAATHLLERGAREWSGC